MPGNEQMSKNRRRTKVVNSSVQTRLILDVAMIPAIGLGVMVAIVSWFCCRLYEESLPAQVELDSLIPLYLGVTGLSLFTVVVLVASAYKLSQRVAGPMFNLCRSLKQIEKGNVAFKVNLRDRDHLNDIAVQLNKVLDKLNENPPPGFTTLDTLAQVAREAGQRAASNAKDIAEPASLVTADAES